MHALVAVMMLAAASPASAAPAPAVPTPTRNEYLAAAKRLYADLEYEKALEQLDHARTVPGNTATEQSEIEKYTGMVKFELGAPDASASFRAALALDPKAELPPTASPKIKAEWTSLKLEMEKADEVRAAANAQAAPPPVPTPSVATPTVDVPPPAPALVAAPEPARVEPAKVDLQLAPAPESRSVVSTVGPWVLLGTGVVAGGAGAFMGISANNQIADAKSNPIQLSAQSQQQTASHDALAANVLYGVAGAAVVAGAIWYFTR